MPRPQHHVATNGADMFVVSDQNPNDTCGGQCACGYHPTDQHGPFIVFNTHMMPKAGRVPKTVICAPCAKSAVLHIERGGEISRVGAASPADRSFDGGEPDAPVDYQKLKARFESEHAGVDLVDIPSFPDWLKAQGYNGRKPKDVTTGIDPNATSLLQARADTSPVAMRGGAVHGRVDDPAAQVGNPDNWGVPEAD